MYLILKRAKSGRWLSAYAYEMKTLKDAQERLAMGTIYGTIRVERGQPICIAKVVQMEKG